VLASAKDTSQAATSAASTTAIAPKSGKTEKKDSAVSPSVSSSTNAITFSGQLLSYCEDNNMETFATLQSVISFAISHNISKTQGMFSGNLFTGRVSFI
jgi:hypothetical protein